jgi:Rieske Fe-S protein
MDADHGAAEREPAGPAAHGEDGEGAGGDLEVGGDRRSFLGGATLLMGAGVVAGYGTFGAFAGRYLYPARDDPRAWFFVSEVTRLAPGESMTYVAPGGARVVIARRGAAHEAESFMALSSTCPHLGCQVHWEGHNNRFFCPCHNGVFDPEGRGIGGPPGDAGQDLPRYPLKVEGGLLYIEVPLPTVGLAGSDHGGGHGDDHGGGRCGGGGKCEGGPCTRRGAGERA